MQIEDSDGEEEEDGGMDREKIANQLFDGDEVINRIYFQTKSASFYIADMILICLCFFYYMY